MKDRALLMETGALLMKNRALLMGKRAFLMENRACAIQPLNRTTVSWCFYSRCFY